MGGVRAPGHSTYEDLRESIMGTLMQLPQSTVIYPGHADATTVAREWESNPFIRVWRGLDPEGTEACTALDRPATLVLQRPRLRRRDQGLGPLGGRQRRHRAGLASEGRLAAAPRGARNPAPTSRSSPSARVA